MERVHAGRRVHLAPAAGIAGTVVLLAVLDATVGLGPEGWLAGVLCGAGLAAGLDAALVRHGVGGPGPAGVITLVRAVLACAVAGLVADALVGSRATVTLVALASVALLLDLVDGPVARRTGTTSDLGARFDMESDAFLIAVLSVAVAPVAGVWVLAIGAMRYLFVAAGRLVPWLRRPVAPRRSAKLVAAVQGVVLAVASADVLPLVTVRVALAAALVLLVWSFAGDLRVQWPLRHEAIEPDGSAYVDPAAPTVPAAVLTVAAVGGLWLALVLPDPLDGLDNGDLLRIPVEGLLLVGLAALLPPLPRRLLAATFGLLAGVLVVLRALDTGFDTVLDRPFHVLSDWSYLGKGVGVLGDSIGHPAAVAVAAGAAALTVVVLVVLPWLALRVARVASEHRRPALRTVLTLGVVWALCSVFAGPAAHVASAASAGLAVDTVDQVRADYADRRTFAAQIDDDAYADAPADRLFPGLRGKDVLLVFVESYGRVAVNGAWFSPAIDDVLRTGTRRLSEAGYDARSAYLTSPTYGAGSWLAHSTFQSGLWVDSEQRYDQLLGSDRQTLTSLFERAGWRTVFDVPANTTDWPEGADFYGYDQMYDARTSGYAGPQFGYASMPDQYTLDHFRRTELGPGPRKPVFAELDLVSSHHPWAPLPHEVPWSRLGDGSVFDGMPAQGAPEADPISDPHAVQRAYGQSIEYTMRTLVSWLVRYPDPDRVLIVLGDHQPHSYVTGDAPGHDVPVSVIAQDTAVARRIRDWGWQPGLLPSPTAPVLPMEVMRNRLLDAFGSSPVGAR
ncbi:CDP-alcohol phosphatidyltransferase family protein [Nocardioides panacisoli]|uniref:CDP-alcohol phosphatidyltransferase family protein n=1 Tax=Nocardioides panacisoli TaxID=627624 RepID=A0ABP7I302_9ACTN